jgi:CRP/FNR family transcriptional regulator, cyclic AMP receptor protein
MNEATLLQRHPFARDLSEAQVSALAACARMQRFPAGAVIFREGGDAGALYLVLSGRIVLEQHVPGKGDMQLENLTGGDMLGLSWLFPSGRWLLDARAVEPTEVLVFDARCVHARMDGDASLGLAVSRHIIEQLYQRLERVRLQRLDVYRGEP